MKFGVRMLTTGGIGLLAFLLVVLFVELPRTDPFSWSEYGANLRVLLNNVFVHHTLGLSQYQIPAEQDALMAVKKSSLVLISALLIGYVLGLLKGILDYGLSQIKLGFLGNGSTWLLQAIPDFMILLLFQWYILHHGNKIRFFAPDGWTGYWIPVVIASIYPVMYIARITFTSISEQEGALYIKTAHAKGLPEWLIFGKHILLNSIGRVLNHFTPLGVYILSSLVLIEYFRNVLGAANRMLLSVDYIKKAGFSGPNFEPNVIIGIAFCFMIIILLFDVVSFTSRKFFDPRSGQEGGV
ncbi:ABC transporter permease subunit [Paenibacillus physcomitrellae]|uniref:ABC transmembrane type-1 domain-containing protein n=1 Tax=Paenibacillus physcomitrellae TaxID=1619311 RepID=A0ABQ1FX65_9BACL|nr:ABC transporter permease subunit [Paenibacillus physcomitrellae]GGA31405.1 hypothetical protein GCM10010917_15620 [Paenibacillus physcomitrellae]